MKSNYGCIYCPWRVFNPVIFCRISVSLFYVIWRVSVIGVAETSCCCQQSAVGTFTRLSTLKWWLSLDSPTSTWRVHVSCQKIHDKQISFVIFNEFSPSKMRAEVFVFPNEDIDDERRECKQQWKHSGNVFTLNFSTQLVACVITSKDVVKKSRK